MITDSTTSMINFHVPTEMKIKFAKQCKRVGLTQSYLMRMLISDYLDMVKALRKEKARGYMK